MPSIGPMEIVIVAALALIVFGPERLPEIARNIGKAIREVRRMASDAKQEFDFSFDDEPTVKRPTTKPAPGAEKHAPEDAPPIARPPEGDSRPPEGDAEPAPDPGTEDGSGPKDDG